jgi:hypothetical protein
MPDAIQTKCAELGIPDWRNANAYPKPTELWLSDWRWEFLRRSPKYREAYHRTFSGGDGQNQSGTGGLELHFGYSTFDRPGAKTPRTSYFTVIPIERGYDYIERTFGLGSPVDPRLSAEQYVAERGRAAYFDKFRETEDISSKFALNVYRIEGFAGVCLTVHGRILQIRYLPRSRTTI